MLAAWMPLQTKSRPKKLGDDSRVQEEFWAEVVNGIVIWPHR